MFPGPRESNREWNAIFSAKGQKLRRSFINARIAYLYFMCHLNQAGQQELAMRFQQRVHDQIRATVYLIPYISDDWKWKVKARFAGGLPRLHFALNPDL
jgi:hypothetical protein